MVWTGFLSAMTWLAMGFVITMEVVELSDSQLIELNEMAASYSDQPIESISAIKAPGGSGPTAAYVRFVREVSGTYAYDRSLRLCNRNWERCHPCEEDSTDCVSLGNWIIRPAAISTKTLRLFIVECDTIVTFLDPQVDYNDAQRTLESVYAGSVEKQGSRDLKSIIDKGISSIRKGSRLREPGPDRELRISIQTKGCCGEALWFRISEDDVILMYQSD